MEDIGRPHILVIDDEETIREGCRLTLEKSGYKVLSTGDGSEGIRIARETRPEVAFIDLKMPHISGMEVVDVLSKDIPDTILIVITGYATIVSAVEAMKKGVYDYLPKPFSPDQLRAVTNRAIEHRNLKIEAAKLRAEKEQMERNFITFVSHEMRSPLVTIRQYLEALMTVAKDDLSSSAVEIIDRCNKRIQNLEGLVEHWLDFSRIDDGTLVRSKKPLKLTHIIQQSIEELSPLCEKRGLSVKNYLPPELPLINGDEESMNRVFINIIGNATKYTPNGGEITVRAEADDHYIRVCISDTGEGIPPDKLPFIFEPFYRVKGKEDRHRGSGLGLTFCKRIIEAHNGIIEASSRVGEGTTLTITIPR
jgi:two-component system sensor histidine kinase/response regulator